MISFFRKIRQYLLAENRIGKYLLYALGEIVLVVIGILIALQINNWNELRKEAIEEQKILNVLQSEFQYNQQELQRNILKASRLKSRADSLITFFDSSREKPDTDLISHLIRSLSAYTTFDPSNGALFTLINSGKLDIIKNDSLRLNLSKWLGEVQDVKEDEARLMDFGDTHMDPLRLEYLHFNPDSKLPVNPVALMNNLKFENIVARISFGADYNLENYAILESDIQRILMLITRELKVKE